MDRVRTGAMLWLLAVAPALEAATIFFDDFNNGYAGWSTGGNVFQEDAPCLGPDCVRLKKTGRIWRTVSTAGFTGVTVNWNMAARSLENGDFCRLEVNTGGGWEIVASLANGDDDAVYRSGSAGLSPAADDNPALQIRFRSDSNARGDNCYVDDLSIAGGGPPGGSRTELTWTELISGAGPSAPVDLSAVAEPEGADAPRHVFEGRLVFNGETTTGQWTVLRDDFNYELDAERRHLPEFDFNLVQDGRDLLPVRRGLITTDHSYWTYMLGPGRVWSEPGDNGDSRASVPFALVQQAANCTHNGILTFVFDDTGISDVWYQISQETCLYFKFDMWGLMDAVYVPGPVAAAQMVKADFQQELALAFPTKDISQLGINYPGADPNQFGAGVTPEHMTTYGFVIDGVNYVAGCATRHGAYPYCRWMRLPSFSTAKSAFIGVALMALAEEYGPSVEHLLIRDHVPEHAASRGDWTSTTFGQTLDMATGNFRFAGFMRDEDSTKMGNFFFAEYHADRIGEAFDWPNKAAPGTKFVYRTSDTYILNQAMNVYLESQQGPDADIFDYLVDTVFAPLDIGRGAHTSLRTRDNNWTGPTFGGYGLWWIQDDIAKLATLLQKGGATGGDQILEPGMLAAAMFQNPSDRGFDTGDDRWYNNGFWGVERTPADGYGCTFWVPFMSGYGGIRFVLMPNGTTYWYVSDNAEFDQEAAIAESDRIVSMCPP